MSEISRRTLLAGAALSPLAGGYPIVDSHVHVWKHDPEYPFAPGAHVPARDATPEMLLDLMKANGVSRTVIVQVIHYRYDNRYLAAVLKRYPRLFHGDLNVPMTVLAPIGRMPDVGLLLEKFPELTVVIDHMADCPVDQPAELEKLIALERYPRVFVKISHTWSLSRQPYPWLDAQELVKRLHHAFGPQRLMWATDWPIIEDRSTYDKALTVVRDEMKFFNADDLRWVLSGTVERVWKFDD